MSSSSTTGTHSDVEWVPGCTAVLADVLAERRRQVARYGLQHGELEYGTGPETRWLLPYTTASATDVEQALRDDYEDFEEDTGKPTRLHLLREEFAEAAKEQPGQALYDEVTQVVALGVSWLEDMRATGVVS
jgi:hypothetical protein